VEVVVVSVVLVPVMVEVVVVSVVVVVGQALQQLPACAVPPTRWQRPADLIPHDVAVAVTQHATRAGVPQVERRAHATTALLHSLGRAPRSESPFAAFFTHRR
jgi:hypothetical protein